MAKRAPRAWFASFGRIHYRKIRRCDLGETALKFNPHFDSWESAHAHLLEKAEQRMNKAISEAASAQRAYLKIAGMKEPSTEVKS